MNVAEIMAKRSTCLRRKVGAVLVKDKHIIATGYNGAPVGLEHCKTCLREEKNIPSGQRHELCRAVHAEQNVIIQAALHGANTAGAELYVTNSPCSICAKMLVNAGIKKIVFKGVYPDTLSLEILERAGVELVQYNEEPKFKEKPRKQA